MKTIPFTFHILSVAVVVVGCISSVAEGGLVRKNRFQHNNRYCVKPQPQLAIGPEVSLLQQDSLEGWTNLAGKEPGKAWTVTDGVLHLKGKGGDIITDREYENFILDFQWTISKGGNSGIKYRFKKFDKGGWLGPEYQVLDDFNTGEGLKPKNSTATLYDILPANDKKKLNPNTEMNRGRIVVNGNRIEHWLNGKKVVDVQVGSEAWKDGIAASKFKNMEGFGENSTGRIMVQDHQCEVWFHKISIREIKPSVSAMKSPKSTVKRCNPSPTKMLRSKTICMKKTYCKPTYCMPRCYKPICVKPAYRCYRKCR